MLQIKQGKQFEIQRDLMFSHTSKSHLETETYRIHAGSKVHECDACKKRFTRARALVVHKRTHTGEAL